MADELSLPLLWSDSLLVSALIWALLSILTLYLARRPAHELLDRLGQTLTDILRQGSLLLLTYARKASARNREILRAAASDVASRRVERQLRRISKQVERHLSGYPKLHRALCEQVERIDADYRHAGDTPPTPPAWLDAIAAVASIEANGDPAVAAILKDMHATLEAACHNAMLEYQAANRRRFHSLRRMQPYFSRLAVTLEQLQQRLERVTAHARAVDDHMQGFEALHAVQQEPNRRLNFDLHLRAISGIALLVIAALAAYLNHTLLMRPVEALLGGSPGLRPWAASSTLMLAALGLGVWIAESTGVTRLLGVAWSFDDQQRRRLTALGAFLLSALALLHGILAWSAHASANPSLIPGDEWLVAMAAAALAIILTFTIALAAVPLEMTIHSAPFLLGNLLAKLAYAIATLLRLAAAITAALSLPLKKLYDLWIFLPLWLEHALQNDRHREPDAATGSQAKAHENP